MYTSVTDEVTGSKFHKVEMQLNISVSQDHARFELLCGRIQSIGTTEYEGFQGLRLAEMVIPITG